MASLTNEATVNSSSSSLPRSSTNHQNHYTYEVFQSSSTNHQNHYTYEVFLSFRGKDTRFNFTDHLHTALFQRGIETFRDDGLRRGEEISSALVKAIKESRVSIIVFSQNYASSRWCLDELVEILECRKSKGQEVRAVFYKVDPSDVRHQRGAFGDAFATLDQCKYKDSMDKWKAALKEAADLSGWPFKDGEYESKFINDIVSELSAQVVNPSCELQVAAHPIGIKSCRQVVIRLLCAEENIVRMVGIWGPGGIGKTTVAKDVFNSISHEFEGSCFLADVRSNALVQLQETLLFDILRDSTLKVNNVDKGVGLIKTRMRNKKVLLILDDVSHSSQLLNLVPSPNCFGPGSRILITTRDKRLLIAHQVDEVYEVKMLGYGQALELFSLNAFKSNEPPNDYLELALRAIRYAQGLPLGLIVLGSHLFSRSREEWEATLDSCKEDPHREIRDVLKISYDALGVNLKGYFLDIACFFKGKLVDDVKPILEACYDLELVNGIAQLQEKALIRIDKDWDAKYGIVKSRIWMHDLIEEMGKDIVYQESPGEPGERSRVWSKEDVDHVLTDNTGTDKTIGIQFWVLWQNSEIYLNAKSFSGMKNLRYISMDRRLESECFSGYIDYLSNQLRWLDWSECPLRSFPSDFRANKLVKLNIPYSRKITRLWEGRKNFSRLTGMNLRGCNSLKELPDLSAIPNLKELDLSGCTSLTELPDLSAIPNLKELDLSGCTSLTELPDLSAIPNLKELNLSGCMSLTELPDFSGIPNWKELNLSGCTSLTKLPDFSGIPNMKELNLSRCTSLTELSDFSGIPNLKELNLSGCTSLTELPDFSGIPNLKELNLSGCTSLTELSDFSGIPNLKELNLSGCASLTELPDFSGIPNLKELNLYGCCNLVELPDSVGFLRDLVLNIDRCSNLIMFPRKINWKYVETIFLRSRKLEEFSEVGKEMGSLRSLDLSRTCIKELDESIGNLIGLEKLKLEDCQNLTTLPCSIYGLQNLLRFDLAYCSKLVRFPTNTKILNVDGCSLSLPKLKTFDIRGCSLLSDCDFLMTLDCWETLEWLDLSRNNFVSLPACFTKFVKLRVLFLDGCKRLQGIPELPQNVYLVDKSLERFSKLTNPGAVIEAESSLCSETPKRHCTAEELSTEPLVISPERQRTGQSPIPMIPDLHSFHHSTKTCSCLCL